MTDAIHPGMSADQVAAARELQAAAGPPNPRGPNFEIAPPMDIEHSPAEADVSYEPPRSRAAEDRPSFDDVPAAVRSPGDLKRLEMQARFRQHRADQETEEAEELAEIRRLSDPSIGAADEPTRRVIVRGQEITLTDSELIAAAQKGLAAQSYGDEALAESRRMLDEVKRERAALEALRNGTYQQTEEPPPAFNQRAESGDTLDDLVQELQFGTDPAVAKAKLRDAIAAQAQADRENLELERSKTALAAFTAKNPALSRDTAAMAVMETLVHHAFEADLRALNFDLSQFPDPHARATLHLKMRANGHAVRPIGQIFDEAKQSYERWRDGAPAPRPPAEDEQLLRRGEPRVIVNVDRSERRRGIPTQPPRSAHPMRMAEPVTPDANQIEKRSQAAQDMILQRRAAKNGMRVNSIQARR
jgi:hypothetical protein